MTGLPWIHDDGGRHAAGYTGTTNDCVVRAIAIAARLDYQAVYDRLAVGSAAAAKTARTRNYRSPRNGTFPNIYRPYLEDELGAVWTPTMQIGSGCRVHLAVGEVPAEGRYVVNLSRHLTAVVDGVVRDTHDPCRDGTRCVYGHWRLP